MNRKTPSAQAVAPASRRKFLSAATGAAAGAATLGFPAVVKAQGPITIVLDAGATVVQHLSFASPMLATATASPPTATPMPTPPSLPRTGDASGGSGGNSVALLWAALALIGGIWLLREARLLLR